MWNWKWLGISGVWTIPYHFCPYVGRTQTLFCWSMLLSFHIIVSWIMEELWQGLEYAYASTSGLSVDIWHNVTLHMACRRTWTTVTWMQSTTSELDWLVFHSLLLTFCYTWSCNKVQWEMAGLPITRCVCVAYAFSVFLSMQAQMENICEFRLLFCYNVMVWCYLDGSCAPCMTTAWEIR